MSETYQYMIRIPLERVPVLIGKNGEVKQRLQDLTKTVISVDSEEGMATVLGEDALNLYIAREIIHAIGRGFNPEIAQFLLKQDYGFEFINLVDYSNTKNTMIRLKGRIIGEGGKSRRVIEDLTKTNICVFGKTVGIIGQLEDLTLARRAIEALLSGNAHATVYRWLERKQKERRMHNPL